LGVPLAAVLVVSACGSSSKSNTSTATTTGGAASGTKADSSLPAVTIGFINQEAGSTGAYPETRIAAQAAVDYINNELGGVDKHPIKLDTCATDGTAASSQKCAGQMVSDKVLFVSEGLDVQLSAQYPTLEAANLPVIGGVPVAGADYTEKDAYYYIGGGATTYPGLATYILKYLPNAKKVGVLLNDTAGAASALPKVQKPLDGQGVKTTAVKVPSTQADWLAPFASVKDSDALAVFIGPANCISLAKARDSQQSKVPVVSVSTCYSQATLKGAGNSGLDGWIVNQYFEDPQGDSPDAQTYRQVMGKYAGPNANLSSFAPVSFVDMMTSYTTLLKPLGFSATTDQIVAKIKDPAGGKIFMGPKYVCGAPGAPYTAICNFQLQYFTVQAGKLTQPTGFIDITPTIQVANG
jgi:branched-chain amino acid transport system substrate-binding protein